MDTNPDIRRLEELGTEITRNRDKLKIDFDTMIGFNENNFHLLMIYGKFLLEVTNEEAQNAKYIEKAETIVKNIQDSSKIDGESSKY